MQTSIFSELSGVTIRIQQQIYNMGPDSPLLARVLNNKVIGYSREFLTQYLTYFSPVFLFALGGTGSRYDVPAQGLLYVTFLICLIGALIPLSKKAREHMDTKYVWYLLYLLLLAPFPAAMTYYGSPNIHRSAFLGVILSMFVAYGCYNLLQGIKWKKIVIGVLSIMLVLELIYFTSQYGFQFNVANSLTRNDAQKQVALYVAEKKDEYKDIMLPVEGAMPLYYLFYTNNFGSEYSERFQGDVKLDRVGNVRFIDSSCPSTTIQHPEEVKDTMIIDRPQCPDSKVFKQIKTISGVNPLLKYKVLVSP
jgi:hypothetical protein